MIIEKGTYFLVNDEVTCESGDYEHIEREELVEMIHLGSDELEDDYSKDLDASNKPVFILSITYPFSYVAKEVNPEQYARGKEVFVKTEILLGNYYVLDNKIYCKA